VDSIFLADSNGNDDFTASHLSYVALRFHLLRLPRYSFLSYIFLSPRSLIGLPQLCDTSPPPSPLSQSIPGLSLPYTRSYSTCAIQPVLYLLSPHTACSFSRSHLWFLFPDFLCYAYTCVLCTLLCVCSLSLSTSCEMLSFVCHFP